MKEISEKCLNYGEMEKKIPKQMTQLRNILKEKHEIEVPTKCDAFLARCLRVKDGNLEKAVKLVQAFHTVTADISEWQAPFQPSYYDKDYYSHPGIFPLVTRDSLNRRIFIARANKWDPKILSFDEVLLAVWMFAQYAVANSVDDQRHGFVVIWDFNGTTMEMAWAVKQRRILSMAKWLQNAVVGRMAGFHGVNHPRIVGLIYSGVKPFLSDKIRKRVNFHSNLESLHASLDKSNLPTFLEGDVLLEDCVDKEFMRGLVNSNEYFQDMVNNRFPNK